jgi:hypothetical protein
MTVSASLVNTMASEHLFNERFPQQNFPQKKNSKVDQNGRRSNAAPAADYTHEQEADSRG